MAPRSAAVALAPTFRADVAHVLGECPAGHRLVPTLTKYPQTPPLFGPRSRKKSSRRLSRIREAKSCSTSCRRREVRSLIASHGLTGDIGQEFDFSLERVRPYVDEHLWAIFLAYKRPRK